MRVYLAGPMTGLPDFNFPAFHRAARQLRAQGYDVCSPAENFNGDQSRAWNEYLREGLRQMLTCDAVALLPGWEASKGARLELQVAQQVGLTSRLLEEFNDAG